MSADILARIRALHNEYDGEDSGEPFVDGSAFAELLHERFPEAFWEQENLEGCLCDVCHPPARLLETGSPEQVALSSLLVLGKARPWVLDLLDLTEAQRQDLRKKGLMRWWAGYWHITDAGRAEAARHDTVGRTV